MYSILNSRKNNGISLHKNRPQRSMRMCCTFGVIRLMLVVAIASWILTFAWIFYIGPQNLQSHSIKGEKKISDSLASLRKSTGNIMQMEEVREVKLPKENKQKPQQKIYSNFETERSKEKPQQKQSQPAQKNLSIERAQKLGPNYKNPDILSNGCSITLVLMEPRLAVAKGEVFTAIESAVFNLHPDALPTACLLIQTSSCDVQQNILTVYDGIYYNARSETKALIENGNVRVTILNHAKYRLRSCQNFYNPSNAWMNINYWKDEFVSVDSDLIMTLQKDIVMCHTFNPDLWRDVAYAGAVWPPRANMHNNPVPEEGMCEFLPKKWNEYIKEDRPFPDICKFDDGKAPLGNGGLSLRSRKWLIKAIEYCPHPKLSGFQFDENSKKCIWTGPNPAEDVYFSTILTGMGAPMPLGFEAALFSAEMMMPESVLEYYSTPSNGSEGEKELEEIAIRRWGKDSLDSFQRMRKEGQIIPIGLHKPYWYFDIRDLLGEHMTRECKFMEHMIPWERRQPKFYASREFVNMDPNKKRDIQNFLAQRNQP